MMRSRLYLLAIDPRTRRCALLCLLLLGFRGRARSLLPSMGKFAAARDGRLGKACAECTELGSNAGIT